MVVELGSESLYNVDTNSGHLEAANGKSKFTGNRMAQRVTSYYLEMLSPDELRPKQCEDNTFWIGECKNKLYAYNRFLYELVGNDWQWLDKRSWTDNDWRRYAENENLRTWVGYVDATPAEYYELQKQQEDNVEISSLGLIGPFIGRRLGGIC